MVKERPTIEEVEKVQVVEEGRSWKRNLMKYLKEWTLPNDPIQAKRIKFKVTRFTLVEDELYKRTIDGPLLKCLDEERANIPMVLISDNGTQFQGKAIITWCKELKIRQSFTAVGNPQSNEQIEVTNRTILQHLKMRLKGAKGQWVEELPGVLGCIA
ncbi:UNVERIFIED_CONTAM: hypothetical protein Sradi_3503300 [Sesamum radiatum]|uniref:Integrase catalytic domain-containing protein n=1 Tax=Sesamum radiatum TaxID=300843 RepID=A0AAW2QE57_SESRA